MEVQNKKVKQHKVTANTKSQRVWVVSYIIIAVLCLAVYFLGRFSVFSIPEKYSLVIEHVSLGGFFVIIIFTVSKIIEILITKNAQSNYKRYNLIRLTHLISLITAGILITSFLFANWYAAAVSLGLISLILGFALQTPISSFIGWIYILIRNPYHIGDRIQIGNIKGDVVEISYFDTTLWELAGDNQTNNLPSGKLVHFPNSMVFQSSIINHSWKEFHFVWNEIPFHLAYESDLAYVEKTIKSVTIEELGEEMNDRVEELKTLVKESPIGDIEIKEYPFINLKINHNTWVEVSVTYLVPPRQAGAVRTRIIKRVIAEVLKEPGKAQFPKGNSR